MIRMASLMMLSAVLALSGGQVESTTTDIEAARREYKEAEAVGAMAEVWDLANGGLVEGASMEKLQEAEQLAEELHECEHKDNLEVMADAARDELTPKKHLYGVCTITHYCWCEKCNGRAGHPTASGVNPTVNHTIASASIPFGTKVEINGQVYVSEDRGVPEGWIDIFVGRHDEANARGMYQAEVYIIDD